MRTCPLCDSEILVYRSGNGFSLVCLNCRTGGEVEAESEEEAFSRFVESKGELGGGSFKQVPGPLQKVLSSKSSELVKYRFFPGEEPSPGKAVKDLHVHQGLKRYLRLKGISRLYRFQEEALREVERGENLLVEAPTGSGKTEAFVLPVVDEILSSGSRALFLYPTKALARDQVEKFGALEETTGIKFRVFDGDTPPEERERIIEEEPEVIITTPDLLNLHLTMPWSGFRELAAQASFLVVDEVHTYSGAFGTHLHYIIKRLRRFSHLQLIGSSATIGNAREFGRLLFSTRVKVIREEGGRKGNLHLAMLYPRRKSGISSTVEALRILQNKGYSTIAFAGSHRSAEILLRAGKRAGLSIGLHRAGLNLAARRKVEAGFKEGKLKAVVATPTLELGVDIGEVNAIVSNLVDFTRLSQRLGRAGRKGQESIALLLLNHKDPISGYYRNHPLDYFSDYQARYLEPRNEVIASHQLLLASLDMPLAKREFPSLEGVKDSLLQGGKLTERGGYLVPSREAEGVRKMGIRGVGEKVKIKFQGKTIGERELPLALKELHPGAIYLHGGKSYRSRNLNFFQGGGYAELESYRGEAKTEALRHSLPQAVSVEEKRRASGIELSYSKLNITEVVTGYVEKDLYSGEKLKEVELPRGLKYTFPTYGLFFKAPEAGSYGKGGSFHALEHVLIEGSNTLLGGGSGELGGISLGSTGIIFIYDGAMGGNGLSKLLFERFERACKRSRSILEECPCQRDDGCPQCTYSYQCGNNNSPLFKEGALTSLQRIVEGERTEVKEVRGEKGYV